MHGATIEVQIGIFALHLGAEQFDQLQYGTDVPHSGHVAELHWFGAKQGGGDNRQCRVLGAGYPDFTAQRTIAGNDYFVHYAVLSGEITPFSMSPA